MSCAPWLSRGYRGGRDVTAAGLKHAAAAGGDSAAGLWDAGEQTSHRYQPLRTLPSYAAAAAGAQQPDGRQQQRPQRRPLRKFLFNRGVEEGESTAAVNGECSFQRASDSRAPQGEKKEDQTSPARRLSPLTLRALVPATFSEEVQQHAAARNASSNRSRSSGNSEGSATNSRRSSRIAGGAGSSSSTQALLRPVLRASVRGEKQSDSLPARGGTRVAAASRVSSNAAAKAPSRAAAANSAAHAAQAAAPAATAGGAATAAGPSEAAGGKSRGRLRAAEPLDSKLGQPQAGGPAPDLGVSHGFPNERRGCEGGTENAALSRRTSLSRSSAARGRLLAASREASGAASGEAAAHARAAAATEAAAADAADGEADGATGGRGEAGGAALAENEGHEEGRESPFVSVGGCRYSRNSLLSGRRRTGRLTQRWSSAFLRSRRSAFLSEESVPVVLPMSQKDWIIVDRLMRKINSSNFATVLKAYLIIKTRVAAQRANKEYTQSQRKGKPATALWLLLNRPNNRVALRMRAAETGGVAAAAAPPATAEAAAAASPGEAAPAAHARSEGGRSSRRGSQSHSRDSPSSEDKSREARAVSRSRDEEEGNKQKGRQREMAAAVRGATPAGEGSVADCGETRDVSPSISRTADASSAADNSGASRRKDQICIAGLKGVGEVGRMQAHQSLLEQRLSFLGLRSVCIKGDGNCLFRSCSYNLYGTEEHHRYVRLHATQHMRSAAYRKDYSIFFEGESEFDTYLKNMQRLGTWGDELCVRAIADSFECTIHIITSTDSNWYLRYDPQTAQVASEEEEKTEEKAAHAGPYAAVARSQRVNAVRHIFLTYISPIHYNAFTIAEEDLSGSESE